MLKRVVYYSLQVYLNTCNCGLIVAGQVKFNFKKLESRISARM